MAAVRKSNAKPATTAAIDTVEVHINGKTIRVPTDDAMRKQGMGSLSARIRHLAGLGVPTARIVEIVRRENGEHPIYQHVRNVLRTPLKRDEEAGLSAPGTIPAGHSEVIQPEEKSEGKDSSEDTTQTK